MMTLYRIRLPLLLLTVLMLTETAAVAQLKAGFAASPRSGCPPLVVSFKDNSAGNPTSWKWDLGNGTTSFLQNPTGTYFTSGSYNIKLIVKNATGSDTLTQKKYIIVNALPVPAFSASDTTGCFPLNVKFTDKSLAGSGTITSWKWDFGDGALSDLQNPAHTYIGSGTFTVVLSVTNSNGCTKTLSRSAYINLQNGVKAAFSYTSPAGCHTPTTVNFTNQTVGTGTVSYKWDFGNGNTSIEKDPVNTYESGGVYTVKLIAANSLGCSDTLIKPNAINIGFVKANFTNPDTVCAGAAFTLTNTSNPSTFVSSYWDFGDGTFSDSINPSKIYAAAGYYPVKLVTDFGSCRDSIIKSINVLPPPAASFSAINNTGCGAPLNVIFTNTSVNSLSFLWNFGDGTTSTLENPVHSYTKGGSYTVSLTIKNTSGCPGTLIKKDFVNTTGPKITAIGSLPLKGCIPSTAAPFGIINGNLPGSSYLWDFGDGATSTDSMPSHTYTTTGNFNVKLKVTTSEGCTDTLTIVNGAQIGNKPVTRFSGDPLDVCASAPVTFTDLSTGSTAQSWSWIFGDGTTSILQNPVHTYANAGKFTVTLIASNYGCSDTLKKINYVKVRPPIAKFDTAYKCNDPLTRNFINRSIGALTWQWDFGDGSNSTDSNVSHAYAGPGVYPVTLRVTNGACENTIKKDVVVIKEQGALGTNITESCINTRVSFNIANINASNISSYAWFFNGITQPSTITANPATFVYNTSGVRYPGVVMTNRLNCKDTLYTSVPVTIYGPKAAFGSSNQGTCFGNTVNFIDSAATDGTHPITSWIWNYGEGVPETYTSAPFSHTYSAAGNYNVKLAVKDSYGCTDSISKTSFISITKPVASFTASDTMICPQSPVTFTNTSQGAGAIYFWQFGDGTSSNVLSPVHTYAANGSYTVSMRMTDKNGCNDSAFVNIKIATATAAFALSDTFSSCPPLIVNITNQSSNFVRLNWEFGDGGNSQLLNPSHTYTYPGIYTIKLLINNNGGCSDSLTRRVVIEGPTGIFDYTPKEACNFQTINFSLQSQNSVKYVWDFDDGSAIISPSPKQSHTYTTAGAYLPKVILEDANGCKVPLLGLDTVYIFGIEANISSASRVICDSGIIAFKDSTVSNDIVSNWMWDFGDGTTSPLQSPDHNFTKTGFYTVTLISKTRFGCADTAVSQKYIKIVSSPQVKIAGDTSACEPAQLSFQGEFVRTNTSEVTWNWNFGNGKTANSMNPGIQYFTNAGTYPVTLKVTNSDGCFDSVARLAIIHPKPQLNAGADTAICKFTASTLHATGADSYTWNADPSLSCTNCAEPTANPDKTSTYYLSGKTIFGCTNEDSVTVKVQQPFKIVVSKDDTVCRGESVFLTATGADLFEWTPSLWLDNAKSATPKSTPDSTITYKVVAKDSLGCFKDEGSVNLRVYPKPAIEITNGDNIIVKAGTSVKLTTKSSTDVIDWKWYPGKWLSCSSCAEPITAPQDNITYSVIAANEGHCEAKDEVTINIICNNANVYIPNTFSPNNDGANDVFYPRGTGLYKIKSFKIFNRWGQIVFSKGEMSANDPQYGWNGTLNGVLLQADVYVYLVEVVCSNNTTLPIKGNITLIR
jgi:gliding motility-associated-like protein